MSWIATKRALVEARRTVRLLERIADSLETIAHAAASQVRQPRKPAATEFATLDIAAAEKDWRKQREAELEEGYRD